MVETKSGPELDRAVAAAIGLLCTSRVLGADIEFWADPRAPREVPRTFNPSVDLNDAFYAADAIGLFNESYRGICKEPSDDTWGVVDVLSNCERVISSEDTPSLAICAAILELVKGKQS